MNNIKNGLLSVLVLLMVLGMACSNQEKKFQVAALDFASFKKTRVKQVHFSELGKITKAVKLETTEKSLISYIYKIVIDKNSGDILIGDYDSIQKVLRFNSQGKFITSYGMRGEGPSELTQLLGFCVMDNGDVVLLDVYKILKFSKAGVFLKETRIDYYVGDIEAINDDIYLSVVTYRKSNNEKKSIQIYNSSLVNIGGIGKYDSNLAKYSFTSSNTMAKRGNMLYFADRYDLNLNIYNTTTHELSQLRIPNNNKVLDNVWAKKNFIEEDKKDIKKRLHFFTLVFPFKEGLFLSERCMEKKLFNFWYLNLDRKEAVIFSMFCFFKNEDIKDQNQLFFNSIGGTTNTELIGVFSDPEAFNKYKANYAVLKDVDFQMDDNPILAFYQFY